MFRAGCGRGLSVLFAATVLFLVVLPVAHAQPRFVNSVRDLPRSTELEAFKQQIDAQPRPVDSGSLYSEIQRLQSMRQRLTELRTQRSPIEVQRERFDTSYADSLKEMMSDLPAFCRNAQNAEDVTIWWRERVFDEYVRIVQFAADSVGATAERLANPARAAKPGETCQSYTTELRAVARDFQKTIIDLLTRYQQAEQDKLQTIPEVDRAYGSLIDRMTQDLETARQRQQEDTATSIAQNLWAVIGVLGATAIVILLIVRAFAEKPQMELIQSGQVIQFITVLLLLTVVMALGLSGIIKETTLGTLLGGLGGYVLSQGVGRAAEHTAKKGHSQDEHAADT